MLRGSQVIIRRYPNPTPADQPTKHVIAEYKHRAQTVTCECGWHGSTFSIPGERSAWQSHVAENRPERR
jgi:hypothetical protein